MINNKKHFIHLFFIFLLLFVFIPNVKADSTLIPSDKVISSYYYAFDGTDVNEVDLPGYNRSFTLSLSEGYGSGSYLGATMIKFLGQTFQKNKEYIIHVKFCFSNGTSSFYTSSILNNFTTLQSIRAVVGTSTDWSDNITINNVGVRTDGDLCGTGSIIVTISLTSKIDFNGLRLSWGDTSHINRFSPELVGTYDTFSIWLKEVRYDTEQTLEDSLSGVEDKLNTQNNKTDELIGKTEETNKELGDLNNNITNDNIDNNNVSNAFNDFEEFIDENATISSLITLPVTLFSAILNGMQNSCSPFNLGSLYGEDLILPCINISKYLGSTLWTMIDIIISGFAIYFISQKFIKVFNNFSSMKEGDVIDD